MDALDRTIHQMLRRREAGQLIRSYGVAAFTRKVRWYISAWVGDAAERTISAKRQLLKMAIADIEEGQKLREQEEAR